MPTSGITVVGSLSTDLRPSAARLPRNGETTAASGPARSIGGKRGRGGYPAVAAARPGRRVSMAGAAGRRAVGAARAGTAPAGASRAPATVDDVAAPARTLSLEGDLVVTLGAGGSAVVPRRAGRATRVPARGGASPVESARRAGAVASVTTARHGGPGSLPAGADVPGSPSRTQRERAATR
ncbi:hypothetical protein [Streptomyces iconiensis]|uniref:Uncharacterized protein n=1 Tax=Streptomyces iconiensis TaxID=1384038 RepID=A0ABT6ZWY9_9ACTN|nr:hypothetical protein [Streptomyces iconiensis]MDJ1133574.1 hypothetical protein [Streptomyces iconiensis]